MADVMTWVAFPFSVPLMRLTQDGKDERFKLFIRDFSTLFIGAGIFFLTKGVSGKLLDATGVLKRHPETKRLLSLGAGLSTNALFSGLGAVKLSHWAQDQFIPHRQPTGPERLPETFIVKGGKHPVEMVILPSFSGANTLAVKPMTHTSSAGLDVLSSPWQATPSPDAVAPFRALQVPSALPKTGGVYSPNTRAGLWPSSGALTL